jgi:ABC-type nitrate/sulfonate/bicarbonate transport system permease component
VLAMIIISSIFLVIFPTIAGVRQANQLYIEVARSLLLSRRDEFLKVILPAALPYIGTGLRLAVQAGLVGLIVAEFLYGIPGLGSLIKRASAQRDLDRIFALTIVTMVIGYALLELMTMLERRLTRWRPAAFGAR